MLEDETFYEQIKSNSTVNNNNNLNNFDVKRLIYFLIKII